jgi:hypothetical protein
VALRFVRRTRFVVMRVVGFVLSLGRDARSSFAGGRVLCVGLGGGVLRGWPVVMGGVEFVRNVLFFPFLYPLLLLLIVFFISFQRKMC